MSPPQTPDHGVPGVPPAEPLGGEVVEVELARGLGLPAALAIGVGTLLGGGIFVLPGLVIPRTGPATVLSFLLGGLVALLSAACVAEVATGMPKSGGSYYFASRALGPLWGALVGWSSWIGLSFACAFYMAALGQYVGAATGVSPQGAAIAGTLLLVGLNLIGSQAAGRAQTLITVIEVALLALFVGRGALNAHPALPFVAFMPAGPGAVIAGSAILFISYCGYGEIASMAEEIKDPDRNVPRALLGSVIVVTVLYCAVTLICVALRPRESLVGSTLLADLAGALVGPAGRAAISVGAVLAMVTATNASIMSASRISFAMARDRLLTDWLAAVSPRFRVPDRAIFVTGLLILAMILLGRLELLAEAAGLLYLVVYGLVSVACIVLRGARTAAYRPAFRVPLFPLVPVLSLVGSVAIAAFMAPVTLLVCLAVVAFALLHYQVRGRRRTELRGAWPYFLRRGVLEPALARVERWGALPDELPTALVAVRNPERERARLRVAAALMGASRGRVLVVNVFTVAPEEGAHADVLARYYQTIEGREQALRDASEPIRRAGAEVTSHVPIAPTAFYGLLSAAEAFDASLVLLGWPEPGPDQPAQVGLLDALGRHLRGHLLIMREQAAIPAASILALADPGPHGDLALLAAARMANAWGARLTVATIAPEGAEAAVLVQMQEDLEERVGDSVRADLRVIAAASTPVAVAAEAQLHDMVVFAVADADDSPIAQSVAQYQHVSQCSLVLVRAGEQHPIDLWM